MTSSVERKILKNGKPNTKYVDVLDEDSGIAGQKFTCMSFLSPDKILDKRETFLFNKFVQQWNWTCRMTCVPRKPEFCQRRKCCVPRKPEF